MQSTKKDKSSQSAGSSSQQKADEPESCLDTNMNYINTNRINNFIYMYNIQNIEDNFKNWNTLLKKQILLYTNRFYIWLIIVKL